MNTLTALALSLAFGTSVASVVTSQKDVYFDSFAMFTFFLLLARHFELRVRAQSVRALHRAEPLLPTVARRISEEGESLVALPRCALGDRLRVQQGEWIPTDGLVLAGRGAVDESLLTGESSPKERMTGDKVIAGTLLQSGSIEMSITALAGQTVLQSMVRCMDKAASERPSWVLRAEKMAEIFIAIILVAALLVFAYHLQQGWQHAVWVTLAMLVVTCPCAFSLATPVALGVAVRALAEKGMICLHSEALEKLPHIKEVWFDKTGTLTRLEVDVSQTRVFLDMEPEQALALAASLEQASAHPIAEAFKNAAKQQGLSLPGCTESAMHPLGLEGVCEGHRYLLRPCGEEGGFELLREGQTVAFFKLIERPLPHVAGLIESLKKQGKRCVWSVEIVLRRSRRSPKFLLLIKCTLRRVPKRNTKNFKPRAPVALLL